MLLLACTPKEAVQQTAQAATMTQMRYHCDGDTTVINQLLADGYSSGINDANALVEYYARRLLGTPYVAHTLEGNQEVLTINIHELDCTTFVETLYALARTTLSRRYSWRDYAAHLENLRYRGHDVAIRYLRGRGMSVEVDGRTVASRPDVGRLDVVTSQCPPLSGPTRQK